MPMGDNIRDEAQAKVDGLRAVNRMLREQNRVLATKLAEAAVLAKEIKDEFDMCTHECERCGESDPMTTFDIYRTVVQLAALTAMSQPAQEQCSYCKRPLTDNHSFSYGVPGVPRVYRCDRADCTKPATSQEGQSKFGTGQHDSPGHNIPGATSL